jgi:hypothetical protein
MVTSDLGHSQYWRTLFLNVTLFWRNDPVLGGGRSLLDSKDSWEIKDLELLFHVAVRDSEGDDVSYALNK